MKIASHEVVQLSQHAFTRKEWERESTFAWVGDDPRTTASDPSATPPLHSVSQDELRISHDALLRFQAVSTPQNKSYQQDQKTMADPKVRAICRFLEILTGERVEVAEFSASAPTSAPVDLSSPPAEASQAPEPVGWGLEYDYVQGEYEMETLEYSTTGSVLLVDGGEVTFDLTMVMGREYSASVEVHIRAGDAKLVDPLIINFGGEGVALDDLKFSFDLDADGELDSISLLKPGHGFLAVDWNQDGVINDGSELFGPESGNGFAELSQYDSDGNGWLDENDPLYEKLLVWSRDQAGNTELISLRQAGVGALFLAGQEGEFSLNDNHNVQHGLVRETSFFLKEHGGVGTIQEVDFVV